MGIRLWIANGPAASALLHSRARKWLLRLAGIQIGQSGVMHGCTFGGDLRRLRIGDGSFINIAVSLHPTGGLVIGDRVAIGPGAMIFTGTHDIGPALQRARHPTRFSPVTIGDGCWIGANVVISPGVTVGAGCVIASGAVVISDCEPNGMYAGVPAVRKRVLE